MSDQYPSNIELHRWAEAQPWGHKVSSRVVTKALIAAWDRAHPDRPYVRAEAYHGTPAGYTGRDCRCERCTESASAVSIARYHAASEAAS